MSDDPRPDEMPSQPSEPATPSQPEPTMPPTEAPHPDGDVDVPAPGSVSDSLSQSPTY